MPTLEKEIDSYLHLGMRGRKKDIILIYPFAHSGFKYLDAFSIQNKYFQCKKLCGVGQSLQVS